MTKRIVRLLLPGLIFQAVVIGAGYATGRELVEFFMRGNPSTGLAAMCVTAIVWGITLAIAFENARMSGAEDYRRFLKGLIGPLWLAYEICFAALLIVVLSVLASASGEIVQSRLGWNSLTGVVLMLGGVSALVFFGTQVVERFLAAWSVVLYVLFATILVLCLLFFNKEIGANLASGGVEPGWFTQGIIYAGYNLSVVPGILYCARHLETRSEALTAGLVGGLVAIFPAILFFIAMTAFLPGIRTVPVPIDAVLAGIGIPFLSILFYVALFGIFIKTGAALIHAVNERIAGACEEHGRPLPSYARPAVAVGSLVLATVMAERVGIVELIAGGYQLLTIAFLVIFVLPLWLFGGLRIWRTRKAQERKELAET